eukprot:5260604-Prymnesium_polylepis.1
MQLDELEGPHAGTRTGGNRRGDRIARGPRAPSHLGIGIDGRPRPVGVAVADRVTRRRPGGRACGARCAHRAV